MADARRISEANEHIAAAEKSLKTSFFKWKPDFGSAAHEYEQAAVCFKNAKKLLESKKAYINAAGAHRNNEALFHAAKAYEQAAFIMKELKDWGEVVALFEKAAGLYSEHGTADTAVISLEKAAKMLETVDARIAVDIYQRATDIVELEDRPRQIVDFLGKSARLLVRIQDFDQAAKVLGRERDMRHELGDIDATNRTVSALVLVHLKRGDYVAAEKMCDRAMGFEGYAGSEVHYAVQGLLEAYDSQDDEAFGQIISQPLFKYMDNDYVKLARGLRVPGGGGGRSTKQKANSSAGGQLGAVGGAEEDEEEEEEINLR